MKTEDTGGGAGLRVLIVDDHALFRQGVGRLLEQSGMRVVAGAANGHEGLRCAASLRPDVILIDLDLPGLSGLETTRAIVQERPMSRVIALSSIADPVLSFRARQAGAQACLAKTARADELIALILRVHAGEQIPLEDPVPARPGSEPAVLLSVRECELLRLVAEGLANHEIARRLCVSEKTVRNRMSQTFAALGIHNRTQAAVYALRTGVAVLR